jgi:UDP-N-acetylmuramoylalanine--D-glutamate ligase
VLSPGVPHRLPRRTRSPLAARRRRGADPSRRRPAVPSPCAAAGSKARFAGITGTNGKSTTTALLAPHRRRGRAAGGGRRQSRRRRRWRCRCCRDDGVYVLEMSSYMLERLATLRFDAACMLNLSADHIDRHGDMAGYARGQARDLRPTDGRGHRRRGRR